MSSAIAEREAQARLDLIAAEPMLDELLVGVWEGLTADHVVQCPVCAGPMQPQYGARSRPTGGRCRRCGAGIS